MTKGGRRIPIASAKRIALDYDYDQVIIVAWNAESGRQHVTTFGTTLEHCERAAQGGNFVKKALGWPDEECQAEPSRIRRRREKREGKQPPKGPESTPESTPADVAGGGESLDAR